jgi:hypothetical protein
VAAPPVGFVLALAAGGEILTVAVARRIAGMGWAGG